MRPLVAIAGVALILVILWDAFETVILPRRVTRRIRLTGLFYSSIWAPWSSLARSMNDSKKREKLLQDAHRIILEDAPAIPLWNAMDIYAHRADLVWTAPPDEKVQLKQASFKTK